MVAYNLREARKQKGWTQEEAAQKLERYLGVRWSKSTFSAAERSYERDRLREFTADEILAFASAFELPVAWFFLPPVPKVGADAKEEGEVVQTVLGWPGGEGILEVRLQRILERVQLHQQWLKRASFRHANAILLSLLTRMSRELEKHADYFEEASLTLREILPGSLEKLCQEDQPEEGPEGRRIPDEVMEISSYLLDDFVRHGGDVAALGLVDEDEEQ